MSEFRWPVRVYYEDTDSGGVVYHTGYIRYFERARTEWLRALGYSLQRLATEEGVLFTVVDLAVRYRRPARLDDLLEVVSTADVAGASVLFTQAVHAADGTVLAEGEVRVACVDAQSFRARRMPDWFKTGVA
ncbi:MAG: tol-pal system-associated acyl-CoA thioesterase [Pseudomonadota bacterium]